MDTIEVVNAMRNNDKASAIEKINDLLYNKAAEAMNTYKEILAKSFFDAEEETVEEPVGDSEE